MTNYERIKNMRVEEMAEFFNDELGGSCNLCTYHKTELCSVDDEICIKGRIEYLESGGQAMTTLSKKLCEVAGILPKEKLCGNKDCTAKFEECKKCSYKSGKRRQYFFPDFESDTDETRYNFCKLLEIYTKFWSIDFDNEYIDFREFLIKEAIENCIFYDEENYERDLSPVKVFDINQHKRKFNRALSQTEWRY